MPSTSTNLGLTLFDRVSDTGSTFVDFRDELAGTGNSNMVKIDTAVQDTANDLESVKGVGYTNQTVKGNADNIQINKQKILYTAIASGTNTLTATISELTSVQNNLPIVIVPSTKNTGAVTLNINGYGALPVNKVRNVTGSTVYTSLEVGDFQPNMPMLIIKDSTGARYLASNFGEEYARNVFYANADGTFSTVQTLFDNTVQPLRSSNVTVQAPVNSFASDVKSGLVNYTLGGQSLVNAVVNGDFVNTTGWVAGASTLSATNNILTVTGTSQYPLAYQTTAVSAVAGKKIYARSKQRVTNAICSSIALRLNGSTSGTLTSFNTVSTPVQNQWYSLSGILTITDQTGFVRPYVQNSYASSGDGTGAIMEVRDVIAIDLDAHGLTTKTVSELDAMSDAYFEGLTSVVNPVVVSEGKNILSSAIESGAIDSSGTVTVNTARRRTASYISVKPNTSYVVSGVNVFTGCYWYYYDAGYKFISFSSPWVSSATTPTNCRYMKLVFKYDSAGTTYPAEPSNVQIEEGSTPTTYEPYTSNTLSIPATLRSIPNGVRDTVAQSGNGVVTLTQNVSAEYTTIASDFTVIYEGGVNADYLTMEYAKIPLAKIGTTGIDLQALVINADGSLRHEVTSANRDTVAAIGGFYQGATGISLIFAAGTYATLAAAQAGLAGTKIIYQLATPVVTTLPYDPMISYIKGRFYTNTAIVPQIVYNAPINNTATGQDNTILASNANEFIGKTLNLTTTAKDTLVNAINEINNNVVTASRSADTTTQSPVTSYPTATEDGLVNYTLGGQSLVNGYRDGNFPDTSEQTAVNSTNAVSSNTLQNTGNGGGANPYSYQDNIVLTAGKKIYVRAKQRVTSASAANIKIIGIGSAAGTLVDIAVTNTPTQNQWYGLSGILTVTDQTGLLRIRLQHGYADAATANTKVMEVRDVIAIDLDAHGLTSKTVAELDAMSDAYFEGLTSVVNPVVVSEGKNIFNPNVFDLTSAPIDGEAFLKSGKKSFLQRDTASGITSCTQLGDNYFEIVISSSTRGFWIYFKGEPNSVHTVSCDVEFIAGGVSQVRNTLGIYPYNNLNSRTTNGILASQVTTESTGLGGMLIEGGTTGGTGAFRIKNIMIEKSSTPTTYEPYTSNTLSIPATLRSLPNGVRDTVAQSGNGVVTLTQNVSSEYTLLASDIILFQSFANVDRVTIAKKTDDRLYNSSDRTINSFISTVGAYKNVAVTDDVSNIGAFYNADNTNYGYVFAKGTYANLAAAQTALAGTKILYQLATPVVTTLQTDDWISYKSGRFTTNTAIVPQAVINTPINLAEKGESTFVMASNSESKLASIAMPIPLINTETTITNIASALTEINTAYRTKYDLSKCGACRITAYVKTIGSASAEVRVQYSLDESTWNYLDGLTGPAINISATGTKASAWSSITSLAKTDVFIRVVTINGDGTADPVIGNVVLQAR